MENALVLQAPAMEEAAKASGVYRKQAVLEQWCKEGKLKVEELARAEAKKAEEEERRQQARQERDQERIVYMTKMAAEREEARQKEQA